MTPARIRIRRFVPLAVAVLFSILAIVFWFAAHQERASTSPIDPAVRMTDRVWDTRFIAAFAVSVDVALVAATLAVVRRTRRSPERRRGQHEFPDASEPVSDDDA